MQCYTHTYIYTTCILKWIYCTPSPKHTHAHTHTHTHTDSLHPNVLRLPYTSTIKSEIISDMKYFLEHLCSFFRHYQKYNTDLVRNVGVKFLVRVSFPKMFCLLRYPPIQLFSISNTDTFLYLPGWNSQNKLHGRMRLGPRWLLRHVNCYWQIGQSQRTHDAKITSSWRQNDVAM